MTAFRRTVPIRFAHCDPAGIVFFPQYFMLVNEAVEDWFANELGCSFKRMHSVERLGIPTVRFEADFEKPATLGDMLDQELSVAKIGGTSAVLSHRMMVDGVVIARFLQTIAWVDLDRMRAQPWPEDLKSRMAAYLEEPT